MHHALVEVCKLGTLIVTRYTSHEFVLFYNDDLFQVDVIEGELICPETQRKFQIVDGIPNMLLNENEL